jgi:hypothetical protein
MFEFAVADFYTENRSAPPLFLVSLRVKSTRREATLMRSLLYGPSDYRPAGGSGPDFKLS